jgi:hypothetical protein
MYARTVQRILERVEGDPFDVAACSAARRNRCQGVGIFPRFLGEPPPN